LPSQYIYDNYEKYVAHFLIIIESFLQKNKELDVFIKKAGCKLFILLQYLPS